MNHNALNGIHQHPYQNIPPPSVSSTNPFHHTPSPSPPHPAGRAILSATPEIGLLAPTPGDATFDDQLASSARRLIQAQLSQPSGLQLSAPISPNQSSVPLPIRNPSSKASHAKKQPDGHVKRPRNAFINFRCWFVKSGLLGKDVESDHRKISKIVGRVWNSFRKEDKAPFEEKARIEKEEHHQLHPDYRYAPSSRKNGSSSTKGSTAASSNATRSTTRRRVKPSMNSRAEKRIKLIAELVSGGAGRDGVRQRIKEFDRGVLDLDEEDDSEMGSDDHGGDADSDFEDSLPKKKAKCARARHAAKKKTTALPSLPPLPPVSAHGYAIPSHPAMPSNHSMTTRRRSLSTPSLNTVPTIASSLRRAKAHARASSDLAEVPRTGIRISKGRTTNNSLSASTAFAHMPMQSEESYDEDDFGSRAPSKREQKRRHETNMNVEKESSANVETRASTPFTLPHPSTPLSFLSSTTPISSQSTPTAATPSFGYRTPTPGVGPSTFNSPFINAGWSVNTDFLNPTSPSQTRGSGSQLLEEDLRMYGTLGLDEGPNSLMDEFGLGGFGGLSGLNGSGEVYAPSYFMQDQYPLSGHEAGSMEGVSHIKALTTQNALPETISQFTFPPEALDTHESSSVFDPAYSLSGRAPMNAAMSASSPAPDPVDPSHASEFDYWLNEEYFLSPSRGEKTPDNGEREGDDLMAYRRGVDAVGSVTAEEI